VRLAQSARATIDGFGLANSRLGFYHAPFGAGIFSAGTFFVDLRSQ